MKKKNNIWVKVVTWCALFWILLSVIWVGYTLIFPAPSFNDGQFDVNELSSEQEASLIEMFWEDWKDSLNKNPEENMPEWEEATEIDMENEPKEEEN